MGTMVMPHVDELGSALHSLECSFNDSLRAADESDDCPVCGFARIYVQNLYSTRLFDCIDD
jgi:hypothetical protein